MKKSDKELDDTRKEYYDKLNKSTSSRKKDIEESAFLTCELSDDLFIAAGLSPKMIEDFNELKSRKLLDFSHIENTELMIKYGTANITFIQACEENLQALLNLLYKAADACYEKEYFERAELILKEMLRLKDNRSKVYKLLYSCYKKQGNIAQMTYLKAEIERSDLLLKKKILKELEEEK